MPETPPERLLEPLVLFGTRLGLERITALLEQLGRPQDRFSSVLVAGSNGKGSTACLLAAMASAAGYRSGLYSSPHLEGVTERIRVDGEAVSQERLTRRLRDVLASAESVGLGPPTYFEALTAAALAEFADRRVEVAVLEVGLGGRLDATNAVDPVLSVISEIAYDHERHLGATLEEIAAEKAGILRSGRPAVAWISAPAAERVVRSAARDLGAELALARSDVEVVRRSRWPDGSAVEVVTPTGRYPLRFQLPGRHQWTNLGLAVRAAERLAAAGWPRLDGAAIRRGAAAARWPGRLEWVRLPGAGAVLLDGAHNPSGAEALLRYLEEEVGRYRLLFGALAEKRVERMLPALASGAESVVLTEPPGRAWPAAELLRWVPAGRGRAQPDPDRALGEALGDGSGTLVVAGSIYLLGEVRPALRRRFGVPEPATEPLFAPLEGDPALSRPA